MGSEMCIRDREYLVAAGRQLLPLTGVADLEPGGLVGVARAPLLSVPLGALQHVTHAAEPHPGQTADCQVSAVTSSLGTAETASVVTSPSPALPAIGPRPAFFVGASESDCRHTWEITFDIHDPEWTPSAIEQLGDVLCESPDVFSTSKTDFGSFSLMPFEISVPEGSDHFPAPSHKPYFGQRSGRHPQPVPRG